MARGSDERGGPTVEMVIVAPLLIAMFLFVVGLGRLASAREAVDGAARDAAREASIQRSASQAVSQGTQIAQDSLKGRTVTCQHLVVNVDTSDFTPGGSVAVDVACTVANGDVVLSGIPGSSVIHGNFVAPMDRYGGPS